CAAHFGPRPALRDVSGESMALDSMVPDVGGVRVRRVAVYYGSTFLVTHTLVAGYLLAGGSFRRLDSFVFANLTMLVPGLVAACTARFYFREPVARVLGLSLRLNGWFALAWLGPLLLSAATLGCGLAWRGTAYSPELAGLSARFELEPEQIRSLVHPIGSLSPVWSLLVQGLVLGPTLSAIAGLGEEAGWRGLLHGELAHLGFWRESWIVGLLWGLWHLPLVFEGYGFPNHPWLGACLLLAFTLLAAPLYTFIRIRARSTLACAICHGSFGASMLLTFAPVTGGSELTVGLLSLSGVLIMSLANAALACLPARYRA
ncbi:MAG TPA: CPBP family intramembrane glutamic endopeptidase, partial [Polyangiaceae bacterium]|nr:CPBP family intramembrane glutamic endopeptidase [Polyangiaceae bacterium]